MADIQVKKTGEEPGAASLAVTVPPEHVRQAEERATADYQRRARLPGFRRGKAPAAIVKKQFADDIRQQALQELIRESWTVALEQEKLKPIADPHVHNLKWEVGGGSAGHVRVPRRGEAGHQARAARELPSHPHRAQGDGRDGSGPAERAARAAGALAARDRGEAPAQGPGPGDDRDARGGPGEGPAALPAGAG